MEIHLGKTIMKPCTKIYKYNGYKYTFVENRISSQDYLQCPPSVFICALTLSKEFVLH